MYLNIDVKEENKKITLMLKKRLKRLRGY